MEWKIKGTQYNCQYYAAPKTKYKAIEVMIISFADASTEPNAVVVKLQNTIIACIAMGS